MRITPEFLKQQLYVNARAFFPDCTFRESYAPDYVEYIISVFNNSKYICYVLLDISLNFAMTFSSVAATSAGQPCSLYFARKSNI